MYTQGELQGDLPTAISLHLEGDCQVEGGQLEGIQVFFGELQPSSRLSRAVRDLSFCSWGEYG